MSRSPAALVWFRRDLRDSDQAALSQALQRYTRVYCAFIFDTDILNTLPDHYDRRLTFIHAALTELDANLRSRGGGLIVRHGRAVEEIPRLADKLKVVAVFANHDYEPAAIARDTLVATTLQSNGILWSSHKDQVIFEKRELLTRSSSKPYGVFTPYKKAWLLALTPRALGSWPIDAFANHLAPPPEDNEIPRLEAIGFSQNTLKVPTGMSGAQLLLDDFISRINTYQTARDFPAVKGVSYLSPHLRFGTISIRKIVQLAYSREGIGAQTWLSELIWREFYEQILFNYPHVIGHAFKPEFDAITWEEGNSADQTFKHWQQGLTGYPLVDAAMRQLQASGYMHNRLRMLVASFLTKDLGIDWRRGEQHFANLLLDFDLAANNGGWQWAASTGCDAQPWFRIFNPITQSEKFDAQGRFIRRYVPELTKVPDRFIHAPWKMRPVDQEALACVIGRDYPAPIVSHAEARERTLQRFRR